MRFTSTPDQWVKRMGHRYEDTLQDPITGKFYDLARYNADMKAYLTELIVLYKMPVEDIPKWLTLKGVTVASESVVAEPIFGPWDFPLDKLGATHPRTSGTRSLSLRLGRENNIPMMQLMSILSYNAAKRLGDTGLKAMQERGRMQTGMVADIVVFDPERVTDNSTYDKGAVPSTGYKAVIVNGQVTVRDDKLLGVFAGQPIRFEPEAKPRLCPSQKRHGMPNSRPGCPMLLLPSPRAAESDHGSFCAGRTEYALPDPRFCGGRTGRHTSVCRTGSDPVFGSCGSVSRRLQRPLQKDMGGEMLSELKLLVELDQKLSGSDLDGGDTPASGGSPQRSAGKAQGEWSQQIKQLLEQRWDIAKKRRTALMATNPIFNGVEVSISGYMIPAPEAADGSRFGYLVPQVGMCSHLPPPPPNQLVRVRLRAGNRMPASLYTPVRVSGKLHVDPSDETIFILDGKSRMVSGWTLEAKTIELSAAKPPHPFQMGQHIGRKLNSGTQQ